MLGEMPRLVHSGLQQGHRAFADAQGSGHGVPHALHVAFRRLQLIDDQLDEMAFVAVQGIDLVQRKDLPVHPDVGVATLAHLVEQLAVVSLATHHQRGEKVALLPPVLIHYQVDDLSVGVAGHLLPGDR